jgi:NAD dependent epimerase/dehydratase
MKVLVTGAGGFIGSHLTEALLETGYDVRALVHYNSRNTWGHLDELRSDLKQRLEVRLGDITDPFLARDIVNDCEIVFHLAALIAIPYSYQAPASYLAVNAQGTLNILEACKQAEVRRVIVTSTSEVYGSACYTPMDEGHPQQAQSPYAASKIAADKLAESFYWSYGLPVVILRPFNSYGPRQSARAVIPTVLTQALAGANEIYLGNLAPQRDLTFVEDTARAFILAAEKPGLEGETIHFGQSESLSIGELAEKCLQTVGSKARIVSIDERRRPTGSEVENLICDHSKAKRMLGWKPTISLADGLERTAEYLASHLATYRSEAYVL